MIPHSDQIHQVLLNLLLNSVQAIDGPGLVRVAVFEQGKAAVVTVSDTGRGIPAEHLPNIFRPFYTTKGNGTGLGLSLARRIVEEHHGQIAVESSSAREERYRWYCRSGNRCWLLPSLYCQLAPLHVLCRAWKIDPGARSFSAYLFSSHHFSLPHRQRRPSRWNR
ncbi:MAG: ATP-binding protein [Terriglobales bacterium]